MSEHERDNLDPQQRRAQDAVRGLGVPDADPAFRARLKEQFVSGAVPARESPLATRAPSRIPWFSWGALAAAAVLAWAALGLNSLPGPELLAMRGPGAVVVDGRRADATHPAAVGKMLRPGAHVVLEGEASLDILYPGSLAMRLSPGTDLVLPERPGRWFRRTVAAELAMGEISVRTGPDLAGGELDVVTPAGTAAIGGTLINVFHNDELSCFCLHDGTARVLVDGVDLGAIADLQRRVVFMDGREPLLDAAAPPHLEHMAGLDRDHPDVFSRE